VKKVHQLWLLFHRYGGLVMAIPLIIVALTGSIIAFTKEVNHLITPEYYVTEQPNVPQLSFDILLLQAQTLILPGETILSLSINPDQVRVKVLPHVDMTEEKEPYALYLDPWTGKELSRQVSLNGEPVRDNPVMRFIHSLHDNLALGKPYSWILGSIALLWTIDCFVSWYLTLPISTKDFWRRWKPSWKIKTNASTYRLNFDLHRANGLWLWPILFIFAWSSVSLNLPEAYDPVTKMFFEYNSMKEKREQQDNQQKLTIEKFKIAPNESQPNLSEIIITAKHLATKEASKQGFAIGEITSIRSSNDSTLIHLTLMSKEPRCKNDYEPQCRASLSFDSKTGELFEWKTLGEDELQNEPTGNFITRWIIKLHFGQSLGLAYKIFVSILGLIITMLTVTGIYIWWKKRKARKNVDAKKTKRALVADVAS
jgi:uncharacterized iron-regulated membrane protein